METEDIFKTGGILLLIAGVLSLFYWITAFLAVFGSNVLIPSYSLLISGGAMSIVKNILITVCTVIFSTALILVGFAVFMIPDMKMGGRVDKAEIEERINRLQNIVWKILQRLKEKK